MSIGWLVGWLVGWTVAFVCNPHIHLICLYCLVFLIIQELLESSQIRLRKQNNVQYLFHLMSAFSSLKYALLDPQFQISLLGSGPNGNTVVQNTGGLLFVYLFID